MLEYVFFHSETCRRFEDKVRSLGLAHSLNHDGTQLTLALAEESVDDDLADELDALYDELLDTDRRLYEEGKEESPEHFHAAGLVVNLNSGKTVYARIKPALLTRIMEVLAPHELGELVDAVVDAVENPDPRSFCELMRDAESE
ncbi:MAG: hypothetical protein ABFS23_06345 [Pseudomonadota bacterium]